jgi:hypothetical protein
LASLGVDTNIDSLKFALSNRKYVEGKIQLEPTLIEMLEIIQIMYNTLSTTQDVKAKDDKGRTQRFPLFKDYSARYEKIAGILASTVEDAIESSSYENKKMYYSHQVPNYVGKLIKNLKNIHKDSTRFNEFINSEFKQYSWFYNHGKW